MRVDSAPLWPADHAVVRALLLNPGGRYLRDLAKDFSLSPAGVSDVLRRLDKVGVLTEKRIGNRRYLALDLSSEESDCLRKFFSVYEHTMIRTRSARFSIRASEKLEWMDEAYKFFRGLKKARRDDTP